MSCFGVALAIIALIFLIWALKKLYVAWDRSPTCLIGKTAIVTGSNSGIGFYTAQDFAKRGARVILACRNKNKAEKARDEIIKATKNPNVVVKLVDFASLKSVREFAKEINENEERLDILVNNAGALLLDNVHTEDGLSTVMQTNYFGPFLLTLLLIDLLKKSAPSRIVNVASVTATFAKIDPNNLNVFHEGKFLGKFLDYSNSKLCTMLSTNELAKTLRGTGVTANSLHPGVIASELTRNLPFWNYIKFFSTLISKSPEEGAQTSIYVAVSDETKNISGEYFDNCTTAWLPKLLKVGTDSDLAKQLWQKSEELVKLTNNERKL